MAKKNVQPEVAESLAAVRAFMRLSIDARDAEKAREYLTAQSRESGQFNPSEMKGGTWSIDEANILVEGAGKIERVIIPTTVTPPPESGQPPMPAPVVVVHEGGKWRIDLIATVDRLFGGSVDQAMNELGNAMGKAMEGIGKALGDAMGQAFSAMGGSREPKLPAGEIEQFEKNVLGRDLEMIRRTTECDLTFDIDYGGFLQHDDENTNRQALQRLGDVWRPLEYMIQQVHGKFPLQDRVAVVRVEASRQPAERIIYADNGKIVYRCDPLIEEGYYGVDLMERILPGVVAGMPEPIDPRQPPEKGPVAWLDDDGATLEEKYRVQVLPQQTARLSELVGQEVRVNVEWSKIGSDVGVVRGLFLWGLGRVVGAMSLLAADEEKREMIHGSLEEVIIHRVESSSERGISFSAGQLRLDLALGAGEAGNWYEWEIAEAISAGLMLRERPVIEELKKNAAEWERRLKKLFQREIVYQIDWAGFCSNPDSGRNLFALQLLREHGIDHVYYAVSGLGEKNPNFKEQFTNRVEALRLVHVPTPAEKSVGSDGGAIVIGMALHEGYEGYFTIKELEKRISAVVAAMADRGYEKLAVDLKHEEPTEETQFFSGADEAEEAEEAEEEPEGDPLAEQFQQMRTHIEQTLPVYTDQMVAMVGKAIPIEIDWDSLDEDCEAVGQILNAGLSPVLAGLAVGGQDSSLRRQFADAVERVVLRRTEEASEQGFALDGSTLIYSAVLMPGMPPVNPQLAGTLLKNLFAVGSAKPKRGTKPNPKKAASKKPAGKPTSGKSAAKRETKGTPKKSPPKKGR